MNIDIYLASKSPRRRELLDQIGVRYQVISVNVDESIQAGESPEAYVERLAMAKVQAGRLIAEGSAPVLGSDTAVVVDQKILGKPSTREEGLEMLALLSGRQHEVLTAVAISGAQSLSLVSRTLVQFRQINADEAEVYWATGEPCDKAGGYGIQGLGGAFVSQIQGSYSGVVGLPLYETSALLQRQGIHLFDPLRQE